MCGSMRGPESRKKKHGKRSIQLQVDELQQKFDTTIEGREGNDVEEQVKS